MIYKEFKGITISHLGMGNMRLPTTGPGGLRAPIDRGKAQEIIDYVYANGVNYFDTAYMYHGGESERFLGEALKKYPRESYLLADKMWGMLVQQGRPTADVFEEQLRRCQTDYFDFYLLHNVSESTIDIYMDEKLGILDDLLEQKRTGRIRNLGLSSHGKPATLKRFIERWHCFDFVQIQLNYLDWTLQDAKGQYEVITEHGMPVWVMEPCRGGRLASLSPEADEVLKKANPNASIASWAFRYLQTLPNVQVVLSGMTQMEQAVDNIRTFAHPNPLTEEEQKALEQAVRLLKERLNVPCTKCRYCDGCPKGLDIPELLAMYNELCIDRGGALMIALGNMQGEKKPANCVACGQCAKKCPQNIDIPGIMSKFAETLAKMPPTALPR
ncbi:MAG TPA: aldo/keto reductase [Chloroflexota bacterium]|nr:aldo/keto reductase [Chloroflexota bacterium]